MALNLSYLLVGLIIPLTGPGFFSLRAFLGILACFSMWNLESVYPGNLSEWLLIRMALNVRLMRSDIYMAFNLIIKNTLSSQWPKYMHVCSFLQTVLKFPLCSLCKYWISALQMHHEHSRYDFLPLEFCLPEIMKRFPNVIYTFFLPFHLDSLFTWNWLFILFHLDGQLIKKHLLKIYFLALWYWVSEWINESHLVVSDSFQPHGLYSPWNSPGQNTGVGSLSLL